eukprot:182205-Chlamydomonas_euryale.AAC.1
MLCRYSCFGALPTWLPGRFPGVEKLSCDRAHCCCSYWRHSSWRHIAATDCLSEMGSWPIMWLPYSQLTSLRRPQR